MSPDTGYYLDSFLAPLAPWLGREGVTDIWINRPGELWTESISGGIECHDEPQIDETLLARLSRQVAAFGAQGVNRAQPILSASLPDGSRIQVVAPPATRGGHVIAIRRHISSDLSLSDWEHSEAFSGLEADGNEPEFERHWQMLGARDAPAVLREAVRERRNIIVSGGTSTGKTTFLNALLAEIPLSERLVLIEDTEELKVPHRNLVGLIAARGSLSESGVTAEDLLVAALRLRPDRIILGELRGAEAFTFLRAVNTGHPGSLTTIHADTPDLALERLAGMALRAGTTLNRAELLEYARRTVDLVVQLGRKDGRRGMVGVKVMG